MAGIFNDPHYRQEQGEICHQDIATMENRYQGPITINILDYYCWSLKRFVTDGLYKRKSK